MKGRTAILSIVVVLAVIVAVWIGLTNPNQANPQTLTVFAASSLQSLLDEVALEYRQARGIHILIDYASSGALRAKLEAGASADLFISASRMHTDRLRELNMISSMKDQKLWSNRICVVVGKRFQVFPQKPAHLLWSEIEKVAIADPGHVPAGEYTKRALINLGLWERVKKKLVVCSSARATLAQIEMGTVDAALVFATDAATSDQIEISFEFPQEAHGEIAYFAAIPTAAKNPERGNRLMRYLAGPGAQAVLSRWGFRGTSGAQTKTHVSQNHELEWWTAGSAGTFWLSFKVSFLATMLMILLGAPLAMWMARRRGWIVDIIDACCSLPLIIPPVVTGYLLLILFGPNGPIGGLLETIGLQFALDWKGALIASFILAFPLFLSIAKVAFENADPLLEEAARTLNASPLRVFATITLPPILPGLIAAALLGFARAFGEFGATMMIAGNIPGQTRTVPQAIYTGLLTGKTASAWSLVLISVSIGVGAAIAARLLVTRVRHSMLSRGTHASL